MDDDEYGDADDVFADLLAQSGPSRSAPQAAAVRPPLAQPRPSQPSPAPRIQQPTPQRLDRPPPSNASGTSGPPKVVQPTPQALPARGSGSSILVSPRQKGNPVLACLKSVQWEFSDIPADYGLGLTTCALFLSLKYHRLHPEYIYTRIRGLAGKYNLRILLTMVDIPNHEDALRELSKTSLVSNVTVILAWSAAEAARYLELYKSYEHAGFDAIRGQQASGYAERLVEFVTVPRNINKADAVSLVSAFGSLRHAVNAGPDQVGVVSGWGERKVKAWCKAVNEPFRVAKAGRRVAASSAAAGVRDGTQAPTDPKGKGVAAAGEAVEEQYDDFDDDDADALAAIAEMEAEAQTGPSNRPLNQPAPVRSAQSTSAAQPITNDGLSDGVAAALAKLREKG
ncbi:restriction endonuclease type II-like protein [Chaetomium sp. MPI-SDFR-AT-0129]|nr:restriction endonuclease type II-like protein [Chaetomium sp. MPI-SDFR-AT-0129]